MWNHLFAAIKLHRVRLAKASLLLAVFGVASELLGAAPRQVDVELELGPGHSTVRELRVAYVQQELELHGAHLRYPEGAPERVAHRVRLAPGGYALRVEATSADGHATSHTRQLDVPTEGTVRVRLELPSTL